MSLTLGLAILGALVIAALVAHGMWTLRKMGVKRAAAGHAPPAEERVEPGLHEPGGEPAAAAMAVDLPAPETLAPRRRSHPRLDALVDAIAPLRLEAPVSGELVLTHLPTTRRAGTKPLLIEGLDAETGEWEFPAPGRRYGELQAGVQLANRMGALNEIEYSEFAQKIERFAEAVGAMADFPDMLDVVSRARELDLFAGEHDAQLAVQLRARQAAWSVGYLQQQAARHGFVPGAVPGRLVLPAAEEGAPPVLTLGFDSQAALADDPNRAAVREATLAFDVPQTDPQQQPFSTWQASALALAADLEADIVDDAGRVLGASSFEQIGSELGRLYQELASRDLPAGSAAARRLFS
jgi:hypothetical protein